MQRTKAKTIKNIFSLRLEPTRAGLGLVICWSQRARPNVLTGRAGHLGLPKTHKTLYVLIYAIFLKQWTLRIYIANNKPS